jgi:hypothetical protein
MGSGSAALLACAAGVLMHCVIVMHWQTLLLLLPASPACPLADVYIHKAILLDEQ